jgi:hypothetical protein
MLRFVRDRCSSANGAYDPLVYRTAGTREVVG